MRKKVLRLEKFWRLSKLMRRLGMRDYTWSGQASMLPMWRRTGEMLKRDRQ